jgi:hypothetical protein
LETPPEGKETFFMHKSGCLTFTISVAIIWLVQFLVFLPDFCSWDYIHIGYFMPMLAATASSLVLGFGIGAYLLATRNRPASWRKNLVYVVTGIGVLWLAYSWDGSRALRNFEHRVVAPIPSGITNIQARGSTIFGAEWSFEFQTDEAGLAAIVEARKLIVDPTTTVMEALRDMKEPLIPEWVKRNEAADITYYDARVPETDHSRGRTFWLAYQPAQKRAWFLYYAPM